MSTEQAINYEWSPPRTSDPVSYDTNELATVQSATVASAPVRYATQPSVTLPPPPPPPSQPTPPVDPKIESIDSPPNGDKSDELCRDFLNGRCGREDCKFKHDTVLRDTIRSKVCKDYQKAKCVRVKCKYLHLTLDEEMEFKYTGTVPQYTDYDESENTGPDICRDFLKGLCHRGIKCKYSHQIKPDFGGGGPPIGYGKRPFSAISVGNFANIPFRVHPLELNDQLKQKLIELRRQVLELTQLNDALFSENMKLRTQHPPLDTTTAAGTTTGTTVQNQNTHLTQVPILPYITQLPTGTANTTNNNSNVVPNHIPNHVEQYTTTPTPTTSYNNNIPPNPHSHIPQIPHAPLQVPQIPQVSHMLPFQTAAFNGNIHPNQNIPLVQVPMLSNGVGH